MPHHKISILCTILFFQYLFISNSYAQCSLKTDYKIESKSNGSSILKMKSLEGSRQVKIQLYDLNVGKVVNEKNMVVNNIYQTIFTEVKPSLYVFYVWLTGCNKPIVIGGEKNGILIEN